MNNATDMGPMSSNNQHENAISKVKQACRDGARILTGGQPPKKFKTGYFYEPATTGFLSTPTPLSSTSTTSPG